MAQSIFKFHLYLALGLCTTLLSQTGRSPARALNGMVVSSSLIASEVGRDILERGGNAVDATIATAFALAVTLPSAGNIGGGGFIVYHGNDGETTTFDFREVAPAGANARMFLDENGEIDEDAHHKSLVSVGVPGTVAGLYLAHQRLGSMPWKELVAPAVKLAKRGFPYSWGLYRDSQYHREEFLKHPSTAKKMFKPDGSWYNPGEQWRQPDLAKVLKRIQKRGADGFYRGKTAEALANYMAASGGLITKTDLANYEAYERPPIHGTYRGYDVYSMPPPSSGGIVLVEMLNILEGYDLSAMGHNSANYLHLLTEAMRRGFADRAEHLGDPEFNPEMPIERLISKDYAEQLRSTIDTSYASMSDSAYFNGSIEGESTTHFAVVDGQGNAVSMTYTLENSYGTRIVAPGLGFFLNDEMGDFNPAPGLTNREGKIGTPPNVAAPGKRMLSSMTPTIIAKDGNPLLLVGTPGGRTIINTVLQVTLNVLEHDMPVGLAVEAGRIHHQWLPDVTWFEEWGISPDTQRLYEAMGHSIRYRYSQGSAHAITINREDGIIEGAADSRSTDGGAAGY